MLHIKSPVGDTLPVENEELLQNSIDRAVGNKGRFEPFVYLPCAADLEASTLQESVAVGIE